MQVLFVLVDIVRNGIVREIQYLGRAAVIGLQLEDLRLLVFLRKIEYVLKIGSAEGVDALRIITDHHYIAVDQAHEIYYL